MATAPTAVAIRIRAVPGTTRRVSDVKVHQQETQFRSDGTLAVRDITEDVQRAVAESGVHDGICCVYSPHTTCCVRVNELESGFVEDFAEMLRRLVPHDVY